MSAMSMREQVQQAFMDAFPFPVRRLADQAADAILPLIEEAVTAERERIVRKLELAAARERRGGDS